MSTASKKLLKELPPEHHMKANIVELLEKSHQAAALTGAAYLDHALQVLFLAAMRPLNSDQRARMFSGPNAILGTTSAKIYMAYAMRLIAEQTFRDLLLINDIRNVFAHTLHDVTFETNEIALDCSKLQTFKAGLLTSIQMTAKDRYILTVFSIYAGLRENAERFISQGAARERKEDGGEHPGS